jgi:hypothetical protein
VKEILAKPEYHHFLQAENRGGTAGASGGHHHSPTPPAYQTPPDLPQNMGLAAIMDGIEAIKNQQKPAVPSILNMNVPMGIKRQA